MFLNVEPHIDSTIHIFWYVELDMERAVHIVCHVELYMDRTVHTLWHVDYMWIVWPKEGQGYEFYMDRTVHIISRIWVIHGPRDPEWGVAGRSPSVKEFLFSVIVRGVK